MSACSINAEPYSYGMPTIQGWNGATLYERLAKFQDADVFTVVSRFHDPLLGPEAACYSAHICGPNSYSASVSGALNTPSGPPPPLVLRPDELLALPIAPGGKLAAALLLGWPAGGGGDHFDSSLRSATYPGGGYGRQPVSPGGRSAGNAADCSVSGCVVLGPSELSELRRLAQLLGFGLLSDPRQAASLELLATLFAQLGNGALCGLDDLLAPLLEGLAELVSCRHSLQLQPLLAAVPAGHAAPAVVFARRQQPPLRSGLQRAISTPGLGSRGSHSQVASVARPALGGSVLGLASPVPGARNRQQQQQQQQLGSQQPAPASGRDRDRERETSSLSVASAGLAPGDPRVAAGSGHGVHGAGQAPQRHSSSLLEYLGASAAATVGADGSVASGAFAGISRVKAVRAALSHTLLQRLLRSQSDGGGGGGAATAALLGSAAALSTVASNILPLNAVVTPGPISTLVVADASSQVLEEERPGRDVLLASNLTGANVAALLLCAETANSTTATAAAAAARNSNGSRNGVASSPVVSPNLAASASAVIEAALAEGGPGGGGVGASGGGAPDSRVGDSLLLLPGGIAPSGPLPVPGCLTASCSGPIANLIGTAPAAQFQFRLALYLVAAEAVPVGVLESVAEEMTGLLPLVFEAVHAAINAGGAATAEWYQLTEYCDAGTLLSAARRGDFRLPGNGGPRDGPVWPDLVPLYTSLLEVALALRYLHTRRLVHCDLKPGNVLLKSAPRDPRGWTCKLSDFGCVRLMDELGAGGQPGFRMAQVFGTVAYMSPGGSAFGG
ncbi:hypothetical protein GPECTOR_546g555 [Gonium pectorale]|uniref:Protein kinase domain-containing protein n=1 Tax=Gonium pectorale TaxID=33097 RepID=A0A150FUM3_GONPE|nr:hypothetical protein GPECTOR_546g555 [Gonium pectorale]|eukprot:KXZ41331.1 hypothetical protein GPECTOR_546g555 [Gonium pectorale]